MTVLILLVGLTLGYARFVEPKILLIKEHEIKLKKSNESGDFKVALISDMHWGVYTNGIDPEELVVSLNKVQPDFTLVAGDFLYELKKEQIKDLFEPFKKVNHPVFAVTGNHDEGHPGPNYENYLIDALNEVGVNVINDKTVEFNESVVLIGISDL